MAPLRVAFAGTPAFAAEALRCILQAGFTVPLVLTQPDRPAGRGLKLQPSAVKQLALEHGLAVAQPQGLRLDGRHAEDAARTRQALQEAAPDVMVVAAYGLILPAWALQLPRLGCLNIHASILPRWRGAAPIHRAVEAGDARTGVTIMQMDEGLDTGDMLLLQPVDIEAGDTTASLHDRLASLGGRLVVQALEAAAAGTLRPTPQPPEGVTYAHKIDKSEAAIDWQADAARIERRIRAFDPFPGAHCSTGGETVKIWSAVVEPLPPTAAAHPIPPGTVMASGPEGVLVKCGTEALRLQVVQRPGGRRVPAAAAAAAFDVGTVLPPAVRG